MLSEIKTSVSIDDQILVSQFTTFTESSMNSMLERNGFMISSSPTVKTASFITEVPGRLYVEFEITFHCSDLRGEDRKNSILLLKGDGYYSVESHQFLELRNRGEELSFTDEEEQKRNVNQVILAGSIVLGHRNIEHTIRHKID